MAFESIRQDATGSNAKRAGYDGITIVEAQANYKRAVDAGILKILSKMDRGITQSLEFLSRCSNL